MRVAIYSITRDRLLYSQHCFSVLRERAGHPFDLYVVDNGSEDDTRGWLADQYEKGLLASVVSNDHNMGISYAANQALDMIGEGYDLIIKMDNDCEPVTPGFLSSVVHVYSSTDLVPCVYSPRVEGLARPPSRLAYKEIGGYKIGLTGMVGGIFAPVRGPLCQTFRFDHKNLPMARGADSFLVRWIHDQGGQCGYIEDVVVNHYETTDGQARRYPEYFKRKRKEEDKAFPGGVN